MVIIEFFSRTPIENMISTLVNAPERVAFVGEYKVMKKYEDTFYRFMDAVGRNETVLEFRDVPVHELHEIVRVVEEIVRDYPGCCFDMTGGDSLSMAAMGIVYERYRETGLELHQYNIRTGEVYDCDLNGSTVSAGIPDMTVEQNIILHGGSLVTDPDRQYTMYPWDFSDGFADDVEEMWEICRKDCGQWNFQVTMLGDMLSYNTSDDPLELCLDAEAFRTDYEALGYYVTFRKVFPELQKAGFISDLQTEGEEFFLRFRDEQVKECLTKAGTLLELYTFLSAWDVSAKNGEPFFHDARTGVVIDWDGDLHGPDEEAVDTENEIDVLLMHGAVPVFISCKNGSVNEEELYKLNTVAERFGGKYAKKALVVTNYGRSRSNLRYLYDRAAELKIRIIDDVQDMTAAEFRRKLRALA